MKLQHFSTAGPDEVKAWTIQEGFKAPQAAGRIDTEFEKGFVMVELVKFEEYKVREMEGRYVVIMIVYRSMELRLLRRGRERRLKAAGKELCCHGWGLYLLVLV